MCPVFAFVLDNPLMMLFLGALAVLLFGERLPEVARSFGKGFMELQNGVRGIQREIENAVNSATSIDTSAPTQRPEEREEATAPKFEPPAIEAVASDSPTQTSDAL
jgi:sec-independent protein translocase protein TatA